MCPFEKRHFLTWIDLNPGFGRNWGTFLKKSINGTFIALQMMIFGHKPIMLVSFKSKHSNVFYLAIFLCFRMVCFEIYIDKNEAEFLVLI